MKRRILNILISLDQTVLCLITLGYTDPDMTISGIMYKWECDGKFIGKIGRPFVDFLFSLLEADHCKNSWFAESAQTRRRYS